METIKIQTELGVISALSSGSGPLVLMLHGFPDTKETWVAQVAFFANNGFRAVAVSLRGYEPSSMPQNGDFSDTALAQDVVEVMDALGATSAHLVGHDWGAAIAYRAAYLFPERFNSLTTMAVPHAGNFANKAFFTPKQALMSWYMMFFQLRGISDWWVTRKNFKFLRRLWTVWSPDWVFSVAEFEQLCDAFRKPGVVHAALGYYRAALGPGAAPITPARRAANRYSVAVPTLGLTGANEGCIDAEVFKSLMVSRDFPTGLEVKVIPGAGHFLHREQADEVNEIVLAWLHRHASAQPA